MRIFKSIEYLENPKGVSIEKRGAESEPYYNIRINSWFSDSLCSKALNISLRKYHSIIKKNSTSLLIHKNQYYFEDIEDATKIAEIFESIYLLNQLNQK